MGQEGYEDIVALTVHMSLELMLDYVVEELLQQYKYPMYVSYTRMFPRGPTHNLGRVCATLSNYIRMPVYLAYAVMQMDGWCVNSRYDADFADTVQMASLKNVFDGIVKFFTVLQAIDDLLRFDVALKDAGCKARVAFSTRSVLATPETLEQVPAFDAIFAEHLPTLRKLYSMSRMDRDCALSFVSRFELTSTKQVVARRLGLGDMSQEGLSWGRKALRTMYISSTQDFNNSLGDLVGRYYISRDYVRKLLMPPDVLMYSADS